MMDYKIWYGDSSTVQLFIKYPLPTVSRSKLVEASSGYMYVINIQIAHEQD